MIGRDDNPLIRKFEHLHPLTASERNVLENAFSRVLLFKEDTDVVSAGDIPSECHVLLEGLVARYGLMANGKRQIYSFHIPGDMYDAQSFLLDEMDHSVAALTSCRIAVISHEKVRELTEDYPRIARAIWKETLVDAAIFREWMASLGSRSSYERIAHLMCELYVKNEIVGLAKDGTIPWPITQQELGDALGMSNVHANRTLQELRGHGLITLKGKILAIHEWEGLKQAGQFDPKYLHLKRRTGEASRPTLHETS